MNRKLSAFLGAILTVFVLSSCDLSSIFHNIPADAPTYTGMKAKKKPSENENRSLTRDITDVEIDESVPLIPIGDEFIFEIHFDNPNRYEIQSFTINDVKYASYMFEKGSDLETLYLKSTAPTIVGDYKYTIDAIKYIDGETIRDVKIGGSKTARIETEILGSTKAGYGHQKYGIAQSVKDGERYLLGFYYRYLDVEHFSYFIGDDYASAGFMHTSNNYGMHSCVEVEANFVSEDEFTLRVIGGNSFWNNKYIAVFRDPTEPREVYVVSLTNPDDESFVVYYSQEYGIEQTGLAISKFKFIEEYNGITVRTFMATYPVTEIYSEEIDVFFGYQPGNDEIFCDKTENIFSGEYKFEFAHLYEKI